MNATTQSLSTASPTSSERQWAAGAHLAALLLALCTSWIAGAAGMLGAVIVYLVKRDDSTFAAGHAREAFNFNLSMFIYACVAVAIAVELVGATILTLGLGIILTAPAGLLLVLAVAASGVVWRGGSIVRRGRAGRRAEDRDPGTSRRLRGGAWYAAH